MTQANNFTESFDLIKACLHLQQIVSERNEATYFETDVILLDKNEFEECLSEVFLSISKVLLSLNYAKQNADEIKSLLELLIKAVSDINNDKLTVTFSSKLNDIVLKMAS